jgi:hypothetical protein
VKARILRDQQGQVVRVEVQDELLEHLPNSNRMLEESRQMWRAVTDAQMRKLKPALNNSTCPLEWKADFSLEWHRRGLK